MRVSELARRAGVPVPTIKYYLREGLLAPGTPRGATQADYDDTHVARLLLIRALATVAGLPIARVKQVLRLIDQPSDDLFQTLGEAISTLPPYLPEPADPASADYPRARATLAHLGWVYDPGYTATAQFERAVGAVEDAGIPMTEQRLDAYARAMHEVAEFDLDRMPRGPEAGEPGSGGPGLSEPGSGRPEAGEPGLSEPGSAAVQYAVLGTALYEPVILALRRLAHQDVAAHALSAARAARPHSGNTG